MISEQNFGDKEKKNMHKGSKISKRILKESLCSTKKQMLASVLRLKVSEDLKHSPPVFNRAKQNQGFINVTDR